MRPTSTLACQVPPIHEVLGPTHLDIPLLIGFLSPPQGFEPVTKSLRSLGSPPAGRPRGEALTIKGAFYCGTPASASDPTYSDFWWTPGLGRPPYPLRDLPHFHGSPRTWDLGLKHQILTKWVPTELQKIWCRTNWATAQLYGEKKKIVLQCRNCIARNRGEGCGNCIARWVFCLGTVLHYS